MSKQQATFDDFFSECYLEKRSISRIILLSESATRMKRKIWHRTSLFVCGSTEFSINKDTVWSLLFTIARNIVTDKIRRYYKQEDFVSYIYNNVKDEGRNTTDETLHYHELKRYTTESSGLFLTNAVGSMS